VEILDQAALHVVAGQGSHSAHGEVKERRC
jgi:hypothetical protein